MSFVGATQVLPSAEVGRDIIIDGELLDLTVEGTPHNARRLRVHLQDWLWTVGATSALVDDLTLAVYEALANVVEHAYYPEHPDPVMRLHARLDDDRLLITVTDHGRWRPPRRSGSRGRGLLMMRSLTTEAHVHPTAYGTTVQLRADLQHRSQPSAW